MLHVYDVAPLAFMVNELPIQTAGAVGVTAILMEEPTVTLTVFTSVQEPLFPVTV